MKTTNIFSKMIKTADSVNSIMSLPKVRKFEKTEIASFENGRLVVREDLKMLIYRKRTPDQTKIEELRANLVECSSNLYNSHEDEADSIRATIRKLESKLKFELQEEFLDRNFYIQFDRLDDIRTAIELMEDRQADRIDQALYVIGAPRLDIDLESPEDYTDNRPLFPWVRVVNPNLEKHTEKLD